MNQSAAISLTSLIFLLIFCSGFSSPTPTDFYQYWTINYLSGTVFHNLSGNPGEKLRQQILQPKNVLKGFYKIHSRDDGRAEFITSNLRLRIKGNSEIELSGFGSISKNPRINYKSGSIWLKIDPPRDNSSSFEAELSFPGGEVRLSPGIFVLTDLNSTGLTYLCCISGNARLISYQSSQRISRWQDSPGSAKIGYPQGIRQSYTLILETGDLIRTKTLDLNFSGFLGAEQFSEGKKLNTTDRNGYDFTVYGI